MRSLSSSAALLALVAGPVVGQQLAVYDPTIPGGPGFLEMTAPTLLVPPGSPPLRIYPEIPLLPAPPAFVVTPGDSTFDNNSGFHLYTNGLFVASMATPAFPPVVAPFVFGVIPPAVLGAIGGPVTGMAIDPAPVPPGPVLWLVSAPGVVIGVRPAPAMPVVVNPFAIQPGVLAPIAGLEWDGLGARLLAVDTLGNVYPFFVGGAPAGPMIPGPVGLPGVASDVAIDKTGMPNVWGARSIYVLFGPVFADVTAPGQPKPVYPTGGSPNPAGLAYVPHPAGFPIAVCPCPLFAMAQSITAPMSTGSAGFGVSLSGLPPGQLALFAFDFVYNPAFPLINGIGCGFGLVLGSGTMVSSAVFADAAGVATYPLPLLLPPGFGPIFHQAGTPCAADPVGIVISPMYQISISGY